MKKFVVTSLVLVLALSFCVGMFATHTSAKNMKCDAITYFCDDGVYMECCHRLVTKMDLHWYECNPIGEC